MAPVAAIGVAEALPAVLDAAGFLAITEGMLRVDRLTERAIVPLETLGITG